MPNITPTEEQLTIVEAYKSRRDNLIISARAGAAKTSTLMMCVEAVPERGVLSLAFNKAIAVEMGNKFRGVPNCRAQARTMNSIGHRAWGKAVGKRLQIDAGKTRRILKAVIDSAPQQEQGDLWDSFGQLRQTIDMAKQWGWVPSAAQHLGNGCFSPLITDNEFFEQPDFQPNPTELRVMSAVLTQSIEEAFSGIIDFGDQVYMPGILPIPLESAQTLMVDEAQDLSPLNHALLAKMAAPLRSRIIAVGDSCQAIYAFRGADDKSMSKLQALFAMEERKLTTCFRCPTSVVQEALWRAPDMRSPEWMHEGSVNHPTEWNLHDLPVGAAILCRNNAPLFSIALEALKVGIRTTLKSGEVAKTVKTRLERFGGAKKDFSISQAALLARIDDWGERELMRSRDMRKTQDTITCMKIIAEAGDTLADALAYCDHIMNQEGSIHLMTGHGAKGLEYEDVYFLDSDLCRPKGQDRNIKYVIQTRATNNLTYVELDNLS